MIRKKREAKREWKGTHAKMTVLKREGKGGVVGGKVGRREDDTSLSWG
jgi:hypothetical protein